MPILATAEFFVKPERTEEFLALLTKALPGTRGFEGCEHLETYLDQDEPGHVLLIETWGARSDHESYLEWRMETGSMEMMAPYLTAPPKFAYFDARPEV